MAHYFRDGHVRTWINLSHTWLNQIGNPFHPDVRLVIIQMFAVGLVIEVNGFLNVLLCEHISFINLLIFIPSLFDEGDISFLYRFLF